MKSILGLSIVPLVIGSVKANQETPLKKIEGIYQVSSYTRNSESCDSEGVQLYKANTDHIHGFSLFNTYKLATENSIYEYSGLFDCNDIESCKALNQKLTQFKSIDGMSTKAFTLEKKSATRYQGVRHWVESAKPAHKACLQNVTDKVSMTFDRQNKTFRMEKRSYKSISTEGCDRVNLVSSKNPQCVELEVIKGKFVEKI